MNIIKKTAVFFLAAIICLTGISIPHDKKIKPKHTTRMKTVNSIFRSMEAQPLAITHLSPGLSIPIILCI